MSCYNASNSFAVFFMLFFLAYVSQVCPRRERIKPLLTSSGFTHLSVLVCCSVRQHQTKLFFHMSLYSLKDLINHLILY